VDRFDGYQQVQTNDQSISTTRGTNNQESEQRSFDHEDRMRYASHRLSDGKTHGYSNQESSTLSTKNTFLSTYRSELQKTGKLEMAIADQFHRFKQVIRTLAQGQAAVSVDGQRPIVMNVHHVRTAFDYLPEERRLGIVDGYKRFLGNAHSYCFKPSPDDRETDRLRRFIENANSAAVENPLSFGPGPEFGI
jgi:hypothetical protein